MYERDGAPDDRMHNSRKKSGTHRINEYSNKAQRNKEAGERADLSSSAKRRRNRRLREKRRRMRRKRRIRMTVNLILAGIFLFSVFSYASVSWNKRKARKEFEKLADLTEQNDTADISESVPVISENIMIDDDSNMLTKYQMLYEQNHDMAGWIKIDDTMINYPVMFTPQDTEYYLNRSFDKKDSPSGTPFVGYNCTMDPRSDNIIIYGHNMSDGSMFSTLLSYSDMEFWQKHPIIEFDSLYETGKYKVMAVFYIDVTKGNGHFPFYEFITAESNEEYTEYVDNCKSLALYDTGVVAETGTDLITLVTCSETSSNSNGRIVVVGCKI